MKTNIDLYLGYFVRYRIVIFLSISFILLVAFYVFSLFVKQERFEKINFDTTIRLQYKIPDRMGEVFDVLAFFVSPAISVGAVLVLTAIGCIDVRRRRIRWSGFIIPVAFLLLVGLEVYGKERVESPAPPYFMIKNPTTIFPKYHVIDQYSYPSGHAARALFLGAVGVMLSARMLFRKTGIAGIFFVVGCISLYVLLVSIGKIYLGQHWLSDILGGWILACSMLAFISPFILFKKI